MKLHRIFLVLAALVLVPFCIWGDAMMALFDGEAARRWITGWGAWSWLAVIVLLVLDLFLPIPATGVISAAGWVFGPWLGGALGAAGSFASGMLAYSLSRAFGRRAAERLAGASGLAQNEALFSRGGPWLVALSRWLPVFPEVIACLAGVARMNLRTFSTSLACGCLPLAFTYAAVGALFENEPRWALGLSVALPIVLWLALRPLLKTA